MGGGEVIRKGWLVKSPPLEGGGIKNWRKRFFKLRSSKVLEYYKSEDGDQKGVINLEDCKAVNSDLFHKKYKYVFDIQTNDRVYYLVASSSDEMKNWVEILCNVCGFTLQTTLAGKDPIQPSKTMAAPKTLKSDAVISPPVATLPHSAGGVLFSDQFKPEEPQGDLYSLASAAIYDVQTQLGKSVEVPAGTPLSEALTAKGMGGTPSASSYGQTRMSDSAYFAPHTDDDPVTALYSVPNKSHKQSTLPKLQSATSMEMVEPRSNQKHKALTSTSSDAGTHFRPQVAGEELGPPLSTSSATAATTLGYRAAETLPNGYMRPSQWTSRPRPSNYDYVPPGPPRPAFTTDSSSPSSTQHRSILLRKDSDQTSSPSSQELDRGRTGSHTYINMKELHNEMEHIEPPPQIDRASKPSNPSPPRVNRGLKPMQKLLSEDQSPPDSPPNFPTRSGSLSTNTNQSIVVSDIPKPTNKTMQYTQVQFDSTTGQLSVDSEQTAKNVNTRGPIPLPRGGQGGKGKAKRVNYSAIDIDATKSLSNNEQQEESAEKHVSLGEAEVLALSEKPYVNVNRDGRPDDNTDPDYYTHMRDFTDSLFYTMYPQKNEQNDEDELYEEPRETMAD